MKSDFCRLRQLIAAWGFRPGLWLGLCLCLFCCSVLPARALELVDSRGVTVRLERPAQRIIALYGAFNEILLALDARETLVARTAADAAVIATLLANHAGEEEHYEDLDAEEPPLTYPDADEPDAAAHTAPTSEAFPAQADPFAAESEEDWYGDDSFIEPAANPSYSLENDPGADPWDSPDDADADSRYSPDGETDIDSRYSSEEERSADPYAFPEDGADADPYAFPEDEPPADPYSSPEDAPSENAENGADAWDYDDTSYEEDDTVRYDGESN